MGIMVVRESNSELEILQGLLDPFDSGLDVASAKSLLKIKFDKSTLKKIDTLLKKNRNGTISSDERIVLDKYIRTGHFLDIIHAKAWKSLLEKSRSEYTKTQIT
jgi:hypothetical protein